MSSNSLDAVTDSCDEEKGDALAFPPPLTQATKPEGISKNEWKRQLKQKKFEESKDAWRKKMKEKSKEKRKQRRLGDGGGKCVDCRLFVHVTTAENCTYRSTQCVLLACIQ